MACTQLRRLLLLLLNIVSTSLTLLTGLRESAVFQVIMGYNAHVRGRLRQGSINYDIARRDELPARILPDLVEIADSYKFHSAPTRTPASLGADRSTCMRVNSMNTSAISVYFDDVFGDRPRREQLFAFSISAPNCDVLNLKPAWVQQQCIDQMFQGNATACSEFILAQFDQIKRDRSLQVGLPVDFGVVGAPYLKCDGRPDREFRYLTDLMVLQSFWAGGSFQIEFQSSKCWALPSFVPNNTVGLFRTQAMDQAATMAVAVPVAHEFVSVVSTVYSLFYLGFIINGLRMVVVARRSFVWYFTSATKRAFAGILSFLPFTELIGRLIPVRDRVHIFRFHGKPVVAANLWMNHWLFITLSIMDACLNVRSVYMMLTMGTWLLSNRVTFENFLYVCTPLTKITWITCLAHTLFQRLAQMVLALMQAMCGHHGRGSRGVRFLRWYVDAVALLTTFKIYAIALVIQLYIVLQVKGAPTMSTRAFDPKRPQYGGFPDLASMWGSEIVIDLMSMIAIQIASAHVLVSLLLLTRFRHATHNRILRILQSRYVFVGWDAYVAMDALGIDPFCEPVRDKDGRLVATTYCTGGALLRQLGSSGPSSWVRLAGEDALASRTLASRLGSDHGNGSKKKQTTNKNHERRYPLSVAQEMGVCSRSDAETKGHRGDTPSLAAIANTHGCAVCPLPLEVQTATTDASGNSNRVPFQQRVLHAHVEWTWGSLMLVDFLRTPPRIVFSSHDQDEYAEVNDETLDTNEEDDDDDADHADEMDDAMVIVCDALSLLDPREQKALLAGRLKLRIC